MVDDATEEGEEMALLTGLDAPEQLPSIQRQQIELYADFLPQPVKLWVDAKIGCGCISKVFPKNGLKLIQRPSTFKIAVARLVKSVNFGIRKGSGTGVLSLALAMLVPDAKILATDISELLPLISENIGLNCMQDRVKVQKLYWGGPTNERPDIILASDCVYNEHVFSALVDTLHQLSTKDTLILFCYKKRRKADKRFFGMLKKLFDFQEVEDDPEREIYRKEAIHLYRVTRKN